jgi:predicted kinase
MQENNNENESSAKPIAVFMMGGPGAGKGFIRSKNYSALTALDCDAIKATHPDYDPKNPSVIHEWSRQQLARQFFAQIGKGESFVYDGTGSNAEKYVSLIQQAQDAGFKTVVHYVSCPLNVALARNEKRARTVEESIVREKHSTIAVSFEIVSKFADVSIETVNA